METAHYQKKKFKPLDAILISLIVVVLMSISYLVINPTKQVADARNSERTSELSTIMGKVKEYVDTTGYLPEEVELDSNCSDLGNEICKTGSLNCQGLVDLSAITQNTDYTLPEDPSNTSEYGTGYYISDDGEGNVLLCAPLSERGISISLKQFMF